MNDDKKLELIVDEIDNMFIKIITQYRPEPLSLCGIVLARMAVMAKSFDGKDDYLALLDHAKNTIMEPIEENKLVH
jgi:hypothetical protein